MISIAYPFRRAVGAMRTAPFTHLVAAASIAVALILATVGGFAAFQARALLDAWGLRGEVTVYLSPDVGVAQGEKLTGQIAELSGGSARFVSAEEALGKLAGTLGEKGQALLSLPVNPLPPSVEVVPAARDAASLAALARQLEPLDGVQEVDVGAEWTERIAAFASAVEIAGLLLLPILLVGAGVLAGSVVRLAVHERRREIEILRLVGATDGFVRAPFLAEGLLAGLFGGLLAALGLWILAGQAGARLAEVITLPIELDPLALASPVRLAAVIGAGALLGFVSTLLSVERHLR
ncbi:cell division protein FtsX [Vulgatibacter incomptus]|uniref:Cell division protein FtsX n=1 Tax=Vulgatibacter incomptus TaxID=1391653 RepID=A0A0K1PAA5_9BACT|nr:permease-like cell division protein FtsX [Vulgatibacter incomptus]AKU90346.1 Cell division protein FtsX [Vulgatibacter incomptus]